KALVRFFALAMLVLGLSAPSLAQPAPAQPAQATAPAAQPASPASGPAKVKIGLYINDIQQINLSDSSFVVHVYVCFQDSDPDLLPGNLFKWINLFAPDNHLQTRIYDMPQKDPDGSEYQVFRPQGPFPAKFSTRTSPFDQHKLPIEIEDREFDANRL